MHRIRSSLNIIAILTITATIFFAWQANEVYSETRALQTQILKSLDMRMELESLPDSEFSQPNLERLQSLRPSIESEDRRKNYSDILQAYSLQDHRLLVRRVRDFIAHESRLVFQVRRDLDANQKFAERQGMVAILSAIFGILWMLLTVHLKIFRSVQRLSNRMMDFLVDRYSFQFSEPDGTEFGELQRTFNSLAERVINTMDEMKRLDQAKSEFLSIASHELRTPMTSIKGSLSLLASGVLGSLEPAPARLLTIAEIETDRLIRLINDILDLAKIEAGKLPLACTWMSWDEMVSKTRESLMGLALNAGVKIEFAPIANLEVFMDRDRVQQVLTNLISNAVKFAPKNSAVQVVTNRGRNGDLIVMVIDQGPGIAPLDRELIFEKFRQGTTEKNPLVKGTGLGLAIAKALVEEHGGVIGLKSDVGHGSTFWFTLPKWRDDIHSSEERAA